MRSEHAFALIALILGIVGGVLLCKGAIDIAAKLVEGRGSIDFRSSFLIAIGFLAIVASALIWTGRYVAGGVINLILGLITVFYGKDAEGLLILISGVVGIVAPKITD
ncbi:MAG: hypothetical protein JSV64_01090 [Candidatus Bathyarchaeota archaeon]|nr:MAG: hypothetical protein JSV64_01090 [Candidatus Bathyarchaeota archaeon]